MVFIVDANSANADAEALKRGQRPVSRPFRFVDVGRREFEDR